VLSWQITVVGDPLYRPCGRNLDEMLRELEARHGAGLDWCVLRLLDLNLANGKPMAQAVAVLEQAELTGRSAVLTEKLADLYAALGKPASAAHAYEQALGRDPTPQQRVRLRLTLGEKLEGLGQTEEAYEDYRKLLEEEPDYPDKPGIYRQLLPLARKLNKTAEAERYEAALNPQTSSNGSGAGGK
jgi:tetratricopeptide (TPR) repeat protein